MTERKPAARTPRVLRYPESDVDANIMQALARYRLLSPELMVRAGVGRKRTHLGDRLNALERGGLVKASPPLVLAGAGRLPSLWWLTPKGATVAAEMGLQVKGSMRRTVGTFANLHRQGVGFCAVLLDSLVQELGGQVDPLVFDIDQERQAVEGKPTFTPRGRLECPGLPPVDPDILAVATLPDGISRPIVVEYEVGGESGRNDNMRKKIDGYRFILNNGIIQKKLKIFEPPRILIVCRTEELLQNVRRLWVKDKAQDWPELFLQSVDALSSNPWVNWHRVGEASRALFPRR